MLHIFIAAEETYDEETRTFQNHEGVSLQLEHSLISLSKWESFHEKPFLSADRKTPEEMLSYIQMMILDPDVDPIAIRRCSEANLIEIQNYIDSNQSATTFGNGVPQQRGMVEVVTAELIYYWLVAHQIPFETQYWHLGRLMALIRVCNLKNQKPTKMSKAETAQRYRDLNAERKRTLSTSG